jgi:endoglycosylceramidase
MRSLAAALLAWAAIVLPSGAAALAAPTLPLGHAGRWITDASGRVVIVHGINMVEKQPPYYPSAVGFGDDDAAFLARIGFNAVRVGVIWKALEPSPGVYDSAYIGHIMSTVRTLARHGVLSLLDFHQDMLGERFQGEGAPDWAVQDGGLANPALGFPGNYTGNPALEHALDQLWANAAGPGGVGLQDRFAAAWASVARRLSATSSVLGYELFNEPFPGTLWPSCVAATGCPAFDAMLTRFNRRVASAIRAVDRHTLVWYEPNVLFNFGSSTHVGSLGVADAGFTFHDYCPAASPHGCASETPPFVNALSHVAGTREAVMLTEFGATNLVGDLTGMTARADRFMVPWLEWAYCGCNDPTTSGPGNLQAIVIDPAKAPAGSNLELPTLRALVEPYPQVIAGTPRSWSFDRARRRFTLAYATARARGGSRFGFDSLTEIAAPALVYGGRYAVRVTGGGVVSAVGASTVVIGACRGARRITVTVTPFGRNHSSCAIPR